MDESSTRHRFLQTPLNRLRTGENPQLKWMKGNVNARYPVSPKWRQAVIHNIEVQAVTVGDSFRSFSFSQIVHHEFLLKLAQLAEAAEWQQASAPLWIPCVSESLLSTQSAITGKQHPNAHPIVIMSLKLHI